MISTDRIAVFHYHLLPGGVTNVIFLSLKALIHHHADLREIRLVTGSASNAGKVADRLREEVLAAGRDIPIVISVVPEIGYTTPEEAEILDRRDLKARLLTEFGGYLWWIHNYHLGKNPVFTAALIEAAEETPSQRILFHIHDFPEDGRYSNLSFLKAFAGKDIYPVLPNVRYAVINTRDHGVLSAAGLPEECLFLLNNPVELCALPETDPSAVRSSLSGTFAGEFPAFDPDKPLWLYPVRTIRRKNVLEAALICSVAGSNLLLTLPGVSKQERPYSDLVETLYREGIIPGMWGVGGRLHEAGVDFISLALSSDAIISSSVQEGFGYLYADAVRWKRPLAARNLEILDGIRDLFTGHPAVFYERLEVPLEPRDLRELKRRYTRHSTLTGRKEDLALFLGNLSGSTADFASLHVELQVEMLKRSESDCFRASLRELNESLFTRIGSLHETRSGSDPGIFRRFGAEAFSRTFEGIIETYGQTPGGHDQGFIRQETLVDLFARSNIRHLLYDF